MFERIIFHIDVNAAYLSWEAVYRLRHRGAQTDLREVPAAVGGDVSQRRGIILAKSIPAGQYGIRTGDTIWEAKKKCLHLTLVPPDYELYETCSAAFLEILKDYSDRVEPYSIDEAYMDMTDSCHLFGAPLETAEEIRTRIREELGFTVNIGISTNKLLAKMASDFRKPDRVHTLYPEEIAQKLWPLPTRDLFWVGRSAEQKLARMGIRTIGELAEADPVFLRSRLKKQGEILRAYANGKDLSPVLEEIPPNKGYGNSTTTPYDVETAEDAHKVLLALAETLGSRLRRDGVRASVICVTVTYAGWALETGFLKKSHQKRLPTATNLTTELYREAQELLEELWDGMPVRHLGIHTGGIQREEGSRQLTLFAQREMEKCGKAEAMADRIRRRYGTDAIKRAALLNKKEEAYGFWSRESGCSGGCGGGEGNTEGSGLRMLVYQFGQHDSADAENQG